MTTYSSTAGGVDELKQELLILQERFSNFHKWRGLDGEWDKLLRRQMPTELQPELVYLQEGLDYEGPMPIKAVRDWVNILKTNPTKFDFHVHGTSQAARDQERNLLRWTAGNWNELDEDRIWDESVAEGQVRHGIKVMRLCYRPLEQVTFEDGTRLNPFYWDNCVIDGVYWLGDHQNPDVFYYEYQVPYLGCNLKKATGEKLYLNKNGQIAWLGEHEPVDPDNQVSSPRDKYIKVIIRDGIDLGGEDCLLMGCAHKMRKICTYVCTDAGNYEDAEVLNEDVSPFPFCSFFIVPGPMSHAETDPHEKFRPTMEVIYYLQNWDNYLSTVLASLSRQESGDDNIYGDMSQTNPALVDALQLNKEGGPSFTVERPVPGSGEMAVYPWELKRWPKPTSQYLITQINLIRQLIAEAMPNRYLTGTANTEATNATGTAFLQQAQQAGLEPSGLLEKSDGAIKRVYSRNGMIPHAIRYWAEYSDGDVVFRYSSAMDASTSSHMLRYTDSVKGGDMVEVTYKDFELPYSLVTRTESRTLAEQQAIWLMTKDQYAAAAATYEDLIRATGAHDVEGKKRQLYRERIVKTLTPTIDLMNKLYLLRKATALSGLDFSSLESLPMGDPQDADFKQVPEQGVAGNNNNMILPTNAAQGRSTQQLEYQVNSMVNGPSGGSSPTQR